MIKIIKKPDSKLLIFVIATLLILSLVILLFQKNINNEKMNKSTQTITKNPTEILQSEDIKLVVKKYSETNNENYKDLRNSYSGNWDKTKVDKAYFNLIYADKVGSFSDVFAMLNFLQFAKQSGYDINVNSFGINQDKRDEIRIRAETASKAEINEAQR